MDLSNKSNRIIMLFITYFLGIFGIHWFIQKNYTKGFLYLFSCGGFVVCWIYDVIRCFINIFKYDQNFLSLKEHKKESEISSYKKNKVNYTQSMHQHKSNNPYINAVPNEVYAKSYTDRKAKFYPSNYIVFDTETTGLEPEIDKIIELSAIKYINHEKVDEFSYLIDPCMSLDPYITILTGIKNSDLQGKPKIKDVLPKFFEWSKGFTLVAHNAPFDVKMIACECYRNNLDMFDNKIIDTVTLAKRMFDKSDLQNYKLETIKDYLGISVKSHRALDDCETCSAVYQLYCEKNKL